MCTALFLNRCISRQKAFIPFSNACAAIRMAAVLALAVCFFRKLLAGWPARAALVVAMAVTAPLCADVLRLEYDAGWWRVAQRRGIQNYDPRSIGQFEKAEALGISFATYKRRLSEARATIEDQLGAQ